jgi:hypothetical protein
MKQISREKAMGKIKHRIMAQYGLLAKMCETPIENRGAEWYVKYESECHLLSLLDEARIKYGKGGR